jgi:hypothetical protein
VLLLTDSLDNDIRDAKVKALSACTKVEDIGSAMASMPHYLSVGVNSLASDGITKTVSGMVQILMLILTGVENLLLFIINMYIGTFVCLVVALSHGGLDVAVMVVEGATKVMNDAIGTITGQITDTIEDIQQVINDIPSRLTNFIGVDIDPPQIDISKHLNDLKNIEVNSNDLVKDLVSLNTTLPTFDQVENFTKNAIGIPFSFVREQVNASFGSYKFDDSVFPVAKKQALSFCSNNLFLNDFFNTLFGIVANAKLTFTIVIPTLAAVAILVVGWLEIRGFRSEKARAKEFADKGFDSMDIVYLSSRPMTSRMGMWLSDRWNVTWRTRLLLRWIVAYGTSRPALFVLSLAIAGLFSCICQLIILSSIKKEAPALASQVGNFAGNIVQTLEQVSTNWAHDANGVIVKLQDDINGDLFGWVTNATSAVNNTLNTFDAEIDKALNAVFRETVLFNTARDLVGCLVTRKVDAVQRGLTWVHDSAQVTLPRFSNDVFSQGANDSVNSDSDLTSFLATPSSVTTDEITSAVNSVIGKLEHGIVQETLTSTALLLVYPIVVLIGMVYALTSASHNDRTRAEGGEQYGMKNVRGSNGGDGRANTLQGGGSSKLDQDTAVYAGSVRKGRPGRARWPSQARENSHPQMYKDSDR